MHSSLLPFILMCIAVIKLHVQSTCTVQWTISSYVHAHNYTHTHCMLFFLFFIRTFAYTLSLILCLSCPGFAHCNVSYYDSLFQWFWFQRNYQFDFLRPQHSLFNYFTKLVEQYTKVRPQIEQYSNLFF